jgi:hypothetical protein
MIKTINQLTLATILAAAVLYLPLGVSAQSSNAAPTAPAVPPSKIHVFRNTKLAAVDKANKTVTLANSSKPTLEMTPETKIIKGKDRRLATFDDATEGEEASGSYIKEANGTLVLRTLHLDPKK